MAMKTVAVTCAILFASNVSAHSAEPVIGERQSFKASEYSWQLDLNPLLVLDIYEGRSTKPLWSYDLANCLYCDGVDDNCEADGIVEVNFVTLPEEPILAVVCHGGARCQRFQIFAPWRNGTDAGFSVTGAYYISYEIRSADISVEYDARGKNNSFEPLVKIWPWTD